MSRLNIRAILNDPENRRRLLGGACNFLIAISREKPMSDMIFACPMCGRDDALSVVVSVMANLTQHRDGTNNIETEADGDHEWDGTSYMVCRACGHGGPSYSFENPDYVEK